MVSIYTHDGHMFVDGKVMCVIGYVVFVYHKVLLKLIYSIQVCNVIRVNRLTQYLKSNTVSV